jgi:CBS domain-containing protein
MDDSVTIACSEPNSVLADWQIVEMETLPEASVKHYMTSGAVVADEDATIGDLAKQMSRYSVHRVVIVDDQQRPVGIVSSTDLIAAIDRSAAFVESTLVPCA